MEVLGIYQGKKVTIVRPAASGDVGWDPTRGDLVVIEFDGPHETGKEPHQIVVPREDVKKVPK